MPCTIDVKFRICTYTFPQAITLHRFHSLPATLLLAIAQVRKSAHESGISFREYGMKMLFLFRVSTVKLKSYRNFKCLF